MQVVDHEPHAWFLFRERDMLLLDVNCNHGAVGYGVMIQLNAEEESEYFGEGHAYLNRLAQAVQDSGPGRGHQLRDVSVTYSKESTAAVNEWRASQKVELSSAPQQRPAPDRGHEGSHVNQHGRAAGDAGSYAFSLMHQIVSTLESELLPSFRVLADYLSGTFPRVTAQARSYSAGALTANPRHVIDVDCLLTDARPEVNDNVALVVMVEHLNRAPRIIAAVCWGGSRAISRPSTRPGRSKCPMRCWSRCTRIWGGSRRA
jgi:hypothetical protein